MCIQNLVKFDMRELCITATLIFSNIDQLQSLLYMKLYVDFCAYIITISYVLSKVDILHYYTIQMYVVLVCLVHFVFY
jgi:hypothetical protein